MSGKPLWPHQAAGVDEAKLLIQQGEQAICVTSPTGGGKSRMMEELILWAVGQGWRVALYTHRQILRDQISSTLHNSGITHGLTAAGFSAEPWKLVQVCMMQTVVARSKNGREIPEAKLVIVDECHDQSAGESEGVLRRHRESGAAIIGFTATPVDVGHVYSRLVIAGVNSQLRDCGAHVICKCYEPTVPDIHQQLKKMKTGEFVQGDVVKAIMSPVIFGHVLTHWKRLNPDARPTILFAPGVKESIWFAEQFKKSGVKAAHICGESLIVDGEELKSNRETRRQVLDEVASGEIKVVCNRFVLREGFDLPQLYHGVLATCFGSICSYVQSVGRILRSHPSLEHVVLQDHGGNIFRHGSPNADRVWDMGKTASQISAERKEQLESGDEPQPIVCPECGYVRRAGPQCPSCMFQHSNSCRKVIQLDGTLREISDSECRKRDKTKPVSDEEEWTKLYYIGKHKGWTFKRASGIFKSNTGRWPKWGMQKTPKSKEGWTAVIGTLKWTELN